MKNNEAVDLDKLFDMDDFDHSSPPSYSTFNSEHSESDNEETNLESSNDGDVSENSFDPNENLNKLVSQGYSLHEAIRDIVFSTTKDDEFGKSTSLDSEDTDEAINNKRQEIHEILDNLDTELEGKDVKEVSSIFSSLLDIQSQLCIQKTEGVISVRTRLKHFFDLAAIPDHLQNYKFQEITLIFTPEEVHSVRRKMANIDDSHALYPFFTAILDQAYDVVQYNELTGNLLVEMTKYFLKKLDAEGYGNTSQTLDFKERHQRSFSSFQRALEELKDDEAIINQHLKKFPVLIELPKYLRVLIYIKLNLLQNKKAQKFIQKIKEMLGKYARARGAVQFDFKRYFSQQHSMQLRQKIILKLHQDILQYTGKIFEKEFQNCMQELQSILSEIEANAERLDPSSPEYENLMKRKAQAQRKLEERRKKLDVVKSQERLVDVQHQMISQAMDQFDKNEEMQKRIDEKLRKTKIAPIQTSEPKPTETKKAPSRMVMKRSRSE